MEQGLLTPARVGQGLEDKSEVLVCIRVGLPDVSGRGLQACVPGPADQHPSITSFVGSRRFPLLLLRPGLEARANC